MTAALVAGLTRAGWASLILGAGITLGLFLLAAPALASPLWRRPNVRGRQVTSLPGLFPAASVVLVSAVRAELRPESVPVAPVALAVAFGFGGLLIDAGVGHLARGRGLEAAGVAFVIEAGVALAAAGALAPGRAGVVLAAADVVAGAVVLRVAWPPGVACGAGAAGFSVLAVAIGASPLLEAAAPAAAAAAVLFPLDFRGRLVAGRAAAGTVGAVLGAVVAARASSPGRAAFAAAALLAAAGPRAVAQIRRRRPAPVAG